ncbi:phosphoribosyltransferase family protein [Yoonia sp.]|uniref:phosphoribosyltransferase n=1 Tax=Yoonia sp. TaxID=2212373 RepID=UPI0025F976CA|nr:phosphoribosyltransferase family protein [Yoonia sp.]
MNTQYTFTDRAEAGRLLAHALPPLDPHETVVLALPRGGVPVAEQICKARHLPLDLVFVRKIGVPGQPELAVGAIVDGDKPHVTINHRIMHATGLSETEVSAMGRALLPEIDRRRQLYLSAIKRPDVRGKTAVVVDDGVATGATMRASLLALRSRGVAKVILALPTAPPDVLPSLTCLADQTVCLEQPPYFTAVGAAYRDFPQTTDAEVVAALGRCAKWTTNPGEP